MKRKKSDLRKNKMSDRSSSYSKDVKSSSSTSNNSSKSLLKSSDEMPLDTLQLDLQANVASISSSAMDSLKKRHGSGNRDIGPHMNRPSSVETVTLPFTKVPTLMCQSNSSREEQDYPAGEMSSTPAKILTPTTEQRLQLASSCSTSENTKEKNMRQPPVPLLLSPVPLSTTPPSVSEKPMHLGSEPLPVFEKTTIGAQGASISTIQSSNAMATMVSVLSPHADGLTNEITSTNSPPDSPNLASLIGSTYSSGPEESLETITKNIQDSFLESNEMKLLAAFKDAWKKFHANESSSPKFVQQHPPTGSEYAQHTSKPPQPKAMVQTDVYFPTPVSSTSFSPAQHWAGGDSHVSQPVPKPPEQLLADHNIPFPSSISILAKQELTPNQGVFQVSNAHPISALPFKSKPKRKHMCTHCGKESIYLCSGCHQEWYCGRECQVTTLTLCIMTPQP